MVQVLGPTPFVEAILDKLDSLHSSVSTFDIMVQGLYRESQGRGESVTHYVLWLERKLTKIWVKHPNRVSDADTARYIQDHLFYGHRNPTERLSVPNFTIPWMITWLWGEQLGKLKVNMNRKSITLPVLLNWALLVRFHLNKKEILILTQRILLMRPGQNGLKCNSSWWQLLKELKAHWRKPHDRDPIRGREGTVRVPVPTARDPNGKVTAKTILWPKIIKLRPNGNDQNKIQCYNCQGWGHMWL